jgi:hypothetical protein
MLLVGEKDRLAWVMHCLPLVGSTIIILVLKKFNSPNVQSVIWAVWFIQAVSWTRPNRVDQMNITGS